MSKFFLSGTATEVVLLFMLLEGFVLILWSARNEARMDTIGLLLNLMAGMFLVGAIHCALIGRDWDWIAACLIASLVMHVGDLWRRWIYARDASGSAQLKQQRKSSIS